MKYTLFALMLFVASLATMQAQNARAILDKVSETYSKAGGITASFSLNSEDTKNKMTYSQDGKATLQGDMFKLDVADGITWFDGKTQWVYVKDTDEVNITNPSKDELQGISPIAMFSLYKSGFDLKHKGEKAVGGKTIVEVEMTPNQSMKNKTDITKINVLIDKATNIFSQITVSDKSGFKNVVSIKNMKTGVNLDINQFRFNKSQYPKAEIVDLR